MPIALENLEMSPLQTPTTNPYLESIHLKGFRCIHDITANFLPGLNILIGKNGTGKTNFLTLASSVLGFDFETVPEFKADFHINNGDTSFRLKLDRQASSDITSASKNDGDVFSAEVKTIYQYYGPDYLLGWEDEKLAVPSTGNLEDHLLLMRNIERLYGVSMIKHGTPIVFPFVSSPATIERKEKRNRFPKEVFNNSLPGFSRFLYSHFGFSFNNKSESETLEALNNSVRELSKVVADYTQIEDIKFAESRIVSKNEDYLKIENLQLEFRVNGEWLTFDYLSDGTKRMFYIIAEMSFNDLTEYAYRFGRQSVSVSKGRRHFSTITFLEEPELGVHPHQLTKILDFLSRYSESNQLIFTTHAPQALDILEISDLNRINIVTTSKEGGTEIKKLSDKQKTKAALYKEQAYLRDYWIHSTLEI